MTDKILVAVAQSATSGADFIQTWNIVGDTFTKQTTSGPSGSVSLYGAAFSNDGVYLAVAGTHTGGSNFAVWKRSDTTYTKLTPPTTAAVEANGAAWSASGTYLCVTSNAAPYTAIYKRSGDTLTLVASSLLGAGSTEPDWYGDDYLAFCRQDTSVASLVVYKRTAGAETFTALTVPSQPGAYAQRAVFSSDGVYLATAYAGGNMARIWKRSGDTFTLIASPTTGGEIVRGVCFSTKANYVVFRGENNLYPYKRSPGTDTFTALTPISPSFAGTDRVIFSGDDIHLACASYVNGVKLWRRDGDTFTHLGSPTGFGASYPRSVTFWPNVERDTTYRAISGYVRDKDGNPLSRKVRVYHRVTGNMISETTSSAVDGSYSMDGYIAGENYVIVLDDTKNAMIYDHVLPAPL